MTNFIKAVIGFTVWFVKGLPGYKELYYVQPVLAYCIFISCPGLLGLAIYVTNQRTKEIGIRKVIGATMTQLIMLLSRDFLKLILLAFVIAIPVAWWSANKWLENFAYRTNISWWVFAAGGCIILLFAFAILITKTYKAATANPVRILRSE